MSSLLKGKIYKIEGGGLTYIGSTVDTLSRRLSGHRSDMKAGSGCSSKNVLCFQDAQITLIELYPCGSVEELKMRERYWYDLIPCVNKCKPSLSEQERIDYFKHYKEINKEVIHAKQKIYREANKEHKNAYNKNYKASNKEKIQIYLDANKNYIMAYQQTHREAHREKNKAYSKAYYAKKKAEKAEKTESI